MQCNIFICNVPCWSCHAQTPLSIWRWTQVQSIVARIWSPFRGASHNINKRMGCARTARKGIIEILNTTQWALFMGPIPYITDMYHCLYACGPPSSIILLVMFESNFHAFLRYKSALYPVPLECCWTSSRPIWPGCREREWREKMQLSINIIQLYSVWKRSRGDIVTTTCYNRL